VKKHANKICAAVGDGGNDVTMILEAHAGIGIVGKEGRQASLSSDFSIDRFMDLQRLILVHGRNFTVRSTIIAHILIHQGVIMGTLQCIYILVFWNLPIPIFDGLLMLGLGSLFTKLPLIAFWQEKDVSEHVALNYP